MFAARHDHGVGLAQGFAGLDPAQLHAGFRFQGVEVGEVAQRGQPQYGDLQFGGAFAAAALQQIQGIFWRKELVEPGHHPQHRNAGFLLQPAAALIKEFAASPEAVDQDPFDQRSLHRAEQGQGAHDLGKDAPALDIGHQQAMGPQVLGQAQVGEISGLQIHFHRAARPLEHQPPLGVLAFQGAQAAANRCPARLEPIAVVVLGAGGAHRLAQVNQLTGAVALGFEQDWIHGHLGLQARRPGLQGLGVGHLAPGLIHPGIETHVLALKGQRLLAAALQHPAEGRSHQGFARTAGGAQHHQRSGWCHASCCHDLILTLLANQFSSSGQGK